MFQGGAFRTFVAANGAGEGPGAAAAVVVAVGGGPQQQQGGRLRLGLPGALGEEHAV